MSVVYEIGITEKNNKEIEKKEIVKERRCLQVNYVTFKTDWKVED